MCSRNFSEFSIFKSNGNASSGIAMMATRQSFDILICSPMVPGTIVSISFFCILTSSKLIRNTISPLVQIITRGNVSLMGNDCVGTMPSNSRSSVESILSSNSTKFSSTSFLLPLGSMSNFNSVSFTSFSITLHYRFFFLFITRFVVYVSSLCPPIGYKAWCEVNIKTSNSKREGHKNIKHHQAPFPFGLFRLRRSGA